MATPARIVKRLLAGAALAAGFLIMASVFVPDFSHGDPIATTLPPATEDDALAEPVSTAPSLGTLMGRTHHLELLGGFDEPRYNVIDASTNETVGRELTEQDVRDRFPQIPMSQFEFDGDAFIMLAHPEPSPW